MNWVWEVRSRDGAMNGLEFARCTTGGGFTRVLVHAAPAKMSVEIRASDGSWVAGGELDRDGEYTPMTLLTRDGETLRRSEVWPGEEHHGLPVLLAGGEVGRLRGWRHADDHSWWQWMLEFANHKGRPADWSPPAWSS